MPNTTKSLARELRQIQKYLEINVTNNPEEILERMSNLMAFMARSGEILAIAKHNLRKKKTEKIHDDIIAVIQVTKLSATVQNALLDSICEQESFLVDWAERINRGCTHQLDSLRSMLSYEKEHMSLSKFGVGG